MDRPPIEAGAEPCQQVSFADDAAALVVKGHGHSVVSPPFDGFDGAADAFRCATVGVVWFHVGRSPLSGCFGLRSVQLSSRRR